MILEIIDEMASALDDAVNPTNSFPVQVWGRRVFAPSCPAIDIYPGDPFRSDDAAGFGDIAGAMIFTIRARVGALDNNSEQEVLYLMMDDDETTCVAAALMSDQTLNGYATSVDVDGPSGFRIYEDVPGQGIFLGCEWTVNVIGAHS